MRIFVSYAREDGEVAGRLAAALVGMGHKVFYDKETLRNSGRSFHAEIIDWIRSSDLFVCLVSPDSVDMGFTINELDEAARKWPNLNDGVMAFEIEETDFSLIDPRLSEVVTIERPRGDQVAYIVQAIDHRERQRTLIARLKTALEGSWARATTGIIGLCVLGAFIAIIVSWRDGGGSPPPITTTTQETALTQAEQIRRTATGLKDAGFDTVTVEFGPDGKAILTGAVDSPAAAAAAIAVVESYGLSVADELLIVDEPPEVVEEPPEVVEEPPEPVILTQIAPVQFGVGQHELSDEARSSLDDVARYLTENTDDALAIGGHTDNTGLAAGNLELSQQRAEEAQRYLVDQKQVKADRISLIGFGESRPAASNETVEGRASNRRLEFVTGTWNIYVVRPGDSLRRIAAAEYGEAQRWLDLYRFNQAWIDDPDRLAIGMELVIPPQD